VTFPENRAVSEIMWSSAVQPDTPQMTIWRMRISLWTPKATNTHPQYVIFRQYDACAFQYGYL